MQYLYGAKQNGQPALVATFDGEGQLQSYVHWATLKSNPDGTAKFEQGSALSGGYDRWEASSSPLTGEDAQSVPHNPTPSML